jgi:hypothetical protein
VDVAYEYSKNYPYSSLNAYVTELKSNGNIITPQAFPAYFETASQHKSELVEWLAYNPNTNKSK